MTAPTVRAARPDDLAAVAALHADRIGEGFLSSLGPGFLARLYRRVLRSDDGFVLVATVPDRALDRPLDRALDRALDRDATPVLGFVAGVGSVGALYRRFIVRDGVVAGALAAPRLVRAVPRVVETLRYPAATGDLPDAEILAVAVAEGAAGAGVGRDLVHAATDAFAARGVRAAKVVTTADNAAALAMYRACGFTAIAGVEVHAGRTSEVLVWTAS